MKLNIQLFASGTVDNFTKVKGTTSATLQGKIEWSSKPSEEKQGFSIVTTNLLARRTDNYTSNPTSGYNWKGTVKVGDNAEHKFTGFDKDTSIGSKWVLFATYTDEIKHNTDGTKTITISGSVTGPSGTSLAGVTSKGSKTFELDRLHKVPDEVTFDILEVNEELINAGVSNDIFVKDLSIKSFNISGNTYNNATIKEYGILNRIVPYGTTTLPLIIDFSQNEILTDLTYVTKVPIAGRIIDSYDTAGFSETLLFDYIPYNKIKLVETSTTVKRNGQTSGRVRLSINGNLYNGIVGNIDQSTYKPIVKYKFWQTGTEEPATYDYEIPSNNITIENGVFSVSNYEIGSSVETDINWFNPENAYKVKIYVEDNFTSYESQEKSIAVGEATWTEFKDRVDFKRATKKNNDIYAPMIGDVLITSTNVGIEEMAKRHGGTWELIDKEFTPLSNASGGAKLNSTNTTTIAPNFSRSGHTITFTVSWKNKVNLGTSNLHIWTMDFATLGVSNLGCINRGVAWTEDGDCATFLAIDHNDGIARHYHTIPDSYVSAGRTLYYSCSFTIPMTSMLDSACNKFYWKRIS